VEVEVGALVVGLIASMLAGFAAIHFMLRYLRTRSLRIFVWYRFALAAVVVVVLVARAG
jgi:undecaprenyl-diphosphatase